MVILALGGNLPSAAGSPISTLRQAIEVLIDTPTRLLALSSFYSTPCFPKGAGPDYVNAVAILSTQLTPQNLLKRLHEVEHDFERDRETRWGSRTLDLDLLSYGDLVLPDAQTYHSWVDLDPEIQKSVSPDTLILPHPRIQDRGFVLVPLTEIAPDWCHPVLGTTASDMLKALPAEDLAGIQVLP